MVLRIWECLWTRPNFKYIGILQGGVRVLTKFKENAVATGFASKHMLEASP